jgi:leucyl-tRNA synthetase
MNPDFYCLAMFPYPSGSGLHVGHFYFYAIFDSYCNVMRYKGHKVFQPFGYDSFGLPAENYARSIGRDPREVTEENIVRFRSQVDRMNTNYQEMLCTSDPSYQYWTQWLFNTMRERGMAYKAFGKVNWCPDCQTVLANEQAQNGICERCASKIEEKELNQWYFKITDYKDRLIKNLDWIDYPEATKVQQRHWLKNLRDWCVSRQRKWGCPIPGEDETLDTFVDSSFYYLRYLDPTNKTQLFAPEKYKQVDLYIGGNEHACMHLIYARFVNMFLYDLGIVPEEEPFKRVVHQGMIRFEGSKMGKSKGNAVSPDDYDMDVLRFYLMFIGHYFDGGEWSDQNIVGVERFFNRFRRWMESTGGDTINVEAFENQLVDLTKKFKFNKVVSEFMTLLNHNKDKKLSVSCKEKLVALLRLFAPGFSV